VSANPYPYLQAAPGVDLGHENPRLLAGLNALARRAGQKFLITSGYRSTAEQASLYANRASNPNPVAAPGSSLHEAGDAADVTVGGRPIQSVFNAQQLAAVGLFGQPGDPVHAQVYAPGTTIAQARERDKSKDGGGFDPLGALKDAGKWLITPPKFGDPNDPNTVTTGDLLNPIAGAAGDVAKATGGAIVDLLAKSFGDHAARIGLYIALVAGGVLLLVMGLSRTAGVTAGDVKAGAKLAAVAVPK
jgi:hypothetical protein